jgi:hypothetical protein
MTSYNDQDSFSTSVTACVAWHRGREVGVLMNRLGPGTSTNDATHAAMFLSLAVKANLTVRSD